MLPRRLVSFILGQASFSPWTARHCSSEPSSSGGKTDVVRTVGFSFNKNGMIHSTAGVFWTQNDPRNTAKAAGLRSLKIETDLKLRHKDYHEQIEYWSRAGFATRRGLMDNADLLEKLHGLLQTIEVSFEYKSAFVDGNDEVIAMLNSDEKYKKIREEIDQLPTPQFQKEMEIHASTSKEVDHDSFPPSPRFPDRPTVYVGAMFETALKNHYKFASYATTWLAPTVADLEPDKRPTGMTRRLSIQPATLFRAQLVGILETLKEAKSSGLTTLRVITDSLPFVHLYKIEWKKMDGSPVANHFLYERIRELATEGGMQVSFKAERIDMKNPVWVKVYEAADTGLRMPIESRDEEEYKMGVEELIEGKNNVDEVEGTSTYRVRIFKKGKGCPTGSVWDRMDGSPLEDDVALDESIQSVVTKDTLDLLLATLSEATRRNLQQLVVRTNNKKLVKQVEGYLKVWKRYDWYDSRGRPVVDAEKWRRVDEELSRVEVIWDLVKKMDEEKDKVYLERYRTTVKKEKKIKKKKKRGS